MKTKTARTSGLTLELLKEKSKNPQANKAAGQTHRLALDWAKKILFLARRPGPKCQSLKSDRESWEVIRIRIRVRWLLWVLISRQPSEVI